VFAQVSALANEYWGLTKPYVLCLRAHIAVNPHSRDPGWLGILQVMTASRSGRPSPDGHHDDLSDDDIAGLSLIVPTDARELDADREQWLREGGFTSSPVWPLPPTISRGSRAVDLERQRQRRLGIITAAVLICALVVVAMSGVMGAFVLPPPPAPTSAVPLADATAEPGEVGGLLPEATLAESTTPIDARAIRPAVIALVPNPCSQCVRLLQEVRRQATEYGLRLTIVGTPDQAEQLADIDRALGTIQLDVLIDSKRQLSRAYGSAVPTLLLVRDDGVVADIVRDPPDNLRLESVLVGLFSDFGA
jgi:hypothetical protein